MTDENEDRLAATVTANEYSWRQGQIEVFNWCLIQVRKAFAAAKPGPGRAELEVLGKKILNERDRRFPKETSDDETPTDPASA